MPAGAFFGSFPSGGGGGVTTLNSMVGALTLVAGSGISIVDTAGTITISATGGGAFALQDLSNLTSPTAINQDLLPGVDNARNLGSATLRWTGGYISNLKDTSDVPSIDTMGRILYSSTNTAMLDWSTAGTLDAQTNQVVNVSALGIGNSAPRTEFEISNLTGNGALFLTGQGAGDNGVQIIPRNGAPAFIQGTNGNFSAAEDIAFQLSGGNIGIGPGSITNLLTVNGDASIVGQIHNVIDPTSPQDAATKAYVDSTPAGANTALSNLTNPTAVNQDLNMGGLNINSVGAADFGSVGIGNNNPRSSFEIDNLSGNGAIFLTGRLNTDQGIQIVPRNGAAAFIQGTNGNFTAATDIAFQLSGGNIGIGAGSSVPATLLDVRGTVTLGAPATTPQHVLNTASATGALTGTLTNSPTAGDPAGYIQITINGVTSYIPYWQ